MGEGPTFEAIRASLLALARGRAPKTLCPSEVARAVADDEEAWRALMPRVREAAAALIAEGLIEATQKGKLIDDPRAARGPIRLRLRASS